MTAIVNKGRKNAEPASQTNLRAHASPATSSDKKRTRQARQSAQPMAAFRRLNIGPAGPDCLKNPALKAIIDPTWTHIGGDPANPFIERTRAIWMQCRRWIDKTFFAHSKKILKTETILERTRFIPFHYEMGKRIDLDSGKYSFIYSENYFQRFFIDEADAQFRECFRLLEEGGVLRVVVPDSDLKTYGRPEPVGFPQNLGWSDSAKNKTRWSIYSLVYALENCGYHVKPITWCDKFGNHHYEPPTLKHPAYKNTADSRFAFDISYCASARQSLVVDAVKPANGELAPIGHLVSQLHPVIK